MGLVVVVELGRYRKDRQGRALGGGGGMLSRWQKQKYAQFPAEAGKQILCHRFTQASLLKG